MMKPREQLTDEELMSEYQEGDAKAFEILLNRYHRPIYNLIYRSLGRRNLADDLVQDVFVRVIKARASYTQKAKFKTWLFTIARNLVIDTVRKLKHRKTKSLDQPFKDGENQTLMDRVKSDDPLSDRKLTDSRFKASLENALERLPHEQREVFVMRQLRGLPFKDIAQIVGTSENTIKSRMRYALQSLRDALEEFR